MLKTQQISQLAGFGSILSAPATADRSTSNTRRGSAKQQQQQEQSETRGDISQVMMSNELADEGENIEVGESWTEIGAVPSAKCGQLASVDNGSVTGMTEEGAETGGAQQRRRRRHLATGNSDNNLESPAKEKERNESADREQHSSNNRDNKQSDSALDNKEIQSSANQEFRLQLVWINIILFIMLHSCLPIVVYMLITQRPWKTLLFSVFGIYASGLGVTGGSHRLWSHRCYKASWPVQMLLVALQTMAGQNSIYTWSRDHRVHHKFSETDADPHNIKRGFFFAHMGWLCCKKHPDVKEKGKLIDMSDLEANPFVMFQHKHFWWMSALFTVLLPTMIPVLLWGERFWTSFVFSFMFRYLITLHGTWLVNSAAHYYGHRPYDIKIEARESPYVIFNALGEGFHNYHHTFPYDYAASEFGKYLNITTTFIDLCAAIGLVQDRRKVDSETILRRRLRTGNVTEAELRQKESELNLKREQQHTAASANGTCCRLLQKSIDEGDELSANQVPDNSPLAPLNNIIHELPYISGLTSMKFTM